MDKNPNKSLVGTDTRREFIKKSAAATAVIAAGNPFKTPVYGQNQAPSPGRVIGANDRIVVGYIGTGNQGMAHVRSQHTDATANNIVQVAACDLYEKARNDAKGVIGDGCELYSDYRKLLERKDIDAVTIATVDHWHTRTSIDAMQSGKHVYVEKPMTRYLGEAFQIHDTVKSTGKVLQVGSQGCSDAKWHKAAELIRGGRIGPLVLGQGSYMRNNPKGEWNQYVLRTDATPDTIDWKTWISPVHKKVEFDVDHFFRWRKYYPYCAGLLGDLVPHRLHPLMLASGNPEFPTRVVSIGTRKILTDKNTPGTHMRDVPENVQLLAEFPSGLSLLIISSSVNEQGLPDMIRGHKGSLYFAGNKVDLRPEKPFSDDVDPAEFSGLKPSGEDIGAHEKNWFDSIRENKLPNCNIDLAVRVQTVISLAEMSERLKIACLFDEKTRKVMTGEGKEVPALTYGSSELS